MPPTAHEQLMLELINRLRMDPDGEYARLTSAAFLAEIQGAINYFGVDLASFQAALLTYNPAAPLAWNTALAQAAETHNAAMIAADTQSHQLPGEAGLGTRATNAGYTGWSALGENIYAYSDSVEYGHAGFVIDWGFDDEDYNGNTLFPDWQSRGDGIQDPAGHLNSLMSAGFTEIGIAITAENNAATQVGPFVITQDFGNRFAYAAQFVGVVIDDADNDDFYDIGEGMGGVTVRLSGTAGVFTTTTWEAGGWQIAVPAGTYTITFTGAMLSAPIITSATLGSVNVKVDVEAGGAPAGGTQFGTAGVDTLTGSEGDDLLYGRAGNDVIEGRGGNDLLEGGSGGDTMRGGMGDDTYWVDSLGDSVTELANAGVDTVRSAIAFYLGDNVENLRLAGAATHGEGNLLANTIWGGREAATLYGHEGADTIYGSNKGDIVLGGVGADQLFGNAGVDTIYGEADDDTINGGGNGDFLYGDGGDDTVRGGAGHDLLYGGVGNDTLRGELNNDTLRGEAGADSLLGEDGVDVLIGGADRDIMTGGLGADDFVFDDGDFAGLTAGTADRIVDFNVAQGDDIDLSLVDAISGGADNAFDYIGNAAFSGTAGELRWANEGSNTMVYLDMNGDALADYAIRLDGTINLAEASFFL